MKTISELRGIDISSWQAGMSASALNSVDFAILKISEGQSWVDPQFDTFYNAARIPLGAYVYSHATTVQAAEKEAEKALSLLCGRSCPLGVYLDVEASEQLALPNSQLQAVITAFCAVIRQGGYRVGVYGSAGQLWARVSPQAFGDAFVWVAQWSNNPPSMPCDIWQNTDHMTIGGYSGNVDGDRVRSERFAALVNGAEPSPEPTPTPEPSGGYCEIEAKLPVVKMGDSSVFVKVMQTLLISHGFGVGWMGADGIFGQQTKIGLYEFNKMNGINSEVCDKASWEKLLEVSS